MTKTSQRITAAIFCVFLAGFGLLHLLLREFHGVYLCGDRLIHKLEDTSRADQNIAFLQKLTEKTDLPVYLGLIPTAAEAYRDQLPAGSENFDQAAYLEKVRASVPDAIWVDMEKWMAGPSDASLFYRTDHHWAMPPFWRPWGRPPRLWDRRRPCPRAFGAPSTPPPASTGWSRIP